MPEFLGNLCLSFVISLLVSLILLGLIFIYFLSIYLSLFYRVYMSFNTILLVMTAIHMAIFSNNFALCMDAGDHFPPIPDLNLSPPIDMNERRDEADGDFNLHYIPEEPEAPLKVSKSAKPHRSWVGWDWEPNYLKPDLSPAEGSQTVGEYTFSNEELRFESSSKALFERIIYERQLTQIFGRSKNDLTTFRALLKKIPINSSTLNYFDSQLRVGEPRKKWHFVLKDIISKMEWIG